MLSHGGVPSADHSASAVRTVGQNSSAPMPAPYAPPQMPMMPPPQGGQGQLVCSGCRTLLLYPQGATNVRCAVCSVVTAVPPQGTEMAQLICGGCRTLLMYARGATSVQCSCCRTVNLAMEANQFAHVNCGGCGTMLMFPYGAQCVRCALCQFVSNVGANSMRMQQPTHASNFAPSQLPASTPQTSSRMQTQTVVVENPMTLDESGKLVSNVAVGVTTEKK